MAEGFLGRWSQRKRAAREGRVVEPAESGPLPTVVVATQSARQNASEPMVAEPVLTVPPSDDGPRSEAPLPSMQDVQALGLDSDFKPFVARAVAPEVRNAAMRKLFADPHFNVMDGLDTYIDDYSLPDPLPESMLRKMASAKFLQLFEQDKPEDGATAMTGDPVESPPPAQTTAQAGPTGLAAPPADYPEPDTTDPRI